MKKIFGITLIVIVSVVVSQYINFDKNKTKIEYVDVEKIVEVPVEVEKEMTSKIIEEHLQSIGELISQEYCFTEVEEVSSHKTVHDFNVPFTESGYIYSYEGTICSGIDLCSVSIEKDDSNKIITIFMPGAEIKSIEINHDSFKVYDESSSIFNPLYIEDFNQSLQELKANAEEHAIEKGINEKADENARNVVKQIVLSVIGDSSYIIEFQCDSQ